MNVQSSKIVRFLKQQWILIWLLLAFLGLTSVVVFGSYEEGNYKIKRVVAPAAEIGGLFTSNYLSVGGGVKFVYYQENSTSPFIFPVEIRNYNPTDIDTKYPGEVKYTINVSLAHANANEYQTSEITTDSDWKKGNMSISIALGDDIITLSGDKLSGTLGTSENPYKLTDTHDKDSWIVTFTNIPLNTDYCVKITAMSINQDLDDISQVIGVNAVPTVYTEGWSCSIADDMSKSVTRYDAFNYTITGTGKKDLKFSYDTTVLEINSTFCDYLTEATSGNYSGSSSASLVDRSNWKTITIKANPDATLVNRYDFQMYKVDSFQPSSYDVLTPSSPIVKIKEGEQIPTIYIEFEQADSTS